MPNYYLFRCSDRTYQECIDRMLVGQRDDMAAKVQNVKKDDIIFLHKTSSMREVYSQFIEGPFWATTSGSRNIVSGAWDGDFQWQVKIEKRSDTIKIKQESFQQFQLSYSVLKTFFEFEISSIIGRKLMQEIGYEVDYVENKISSNEIINEVDVDFRLRYQAKFRCEDGHYVRSKNEVIVDNWLYYHGIVHAYEKKIAGQRMVCDFYIKRPNGKEYYLEIWGGVADPIENKRYQDRKKEKINIYNKLNLKLINLEEKQIQNIDDFLSELIK